MSVIPVRKAPALSQPTTAAANTPVENSPAVTEPEPKERLCYQCQHFARSPYGYPLGLCVEYGNRIQHRTSEPARFGCGNFDLKERWA